MGKGPRGRSPGSREENHLQARAVSDRVRKTLAMVAIALAAVLLLVAVPSEPRRRRRPRTLSSRVRGPQLLQAAPAPAEAARHADLGAQGDGPRSAGGREVHEARPLLLAHSAGRQGRRLRIGERSEGQAAEGRLACDHLGSKTTGVADICAPSRDYVGSPANTGESYINDDLNAWLRAGYAVVRTDYEGLGTPGKHPYLIGTSEGHSVLDIVAAARQLDPKISKRYLIAGHSRADRRRSSPPAWRAPGSRS